jgi:hypothetical protein
VFTTPYGNSPKVLVREVVRRQYLLNWRMRTFYIGQCCHCRVHCCAVLRPAAAGCMHDPHGLPRRVCVPSVAVSCYCKSLASHHTSPFSSAARIVQTAIMGLIIIISTSSVCSYEVPPPMPSRYAARIVQTAIMGLIISSMFARIQPVPSEGRNAVAISVLSAIFLSMNSAPQLAFAQLAKPVFLKQRDNQLFPSWAFALTQVITQLPQSTVESIVWSSIVYWIVGLTPTASCFFVYLLVVWSASNCMASLFRLFGFAGKTMVIANSTAMLTLLLMIVSNGFSIVKPSIPPYIIWLYWINPMQWESQGGV